MASESLSLLRLCVILMEGSSEGSSGGDASGNGRAYCLDGEDLTQMMVEREAQEASREAIGRDMLQKGVDILGGKYWEKCKSCCGE